MSYYGKRKTKNGLSKTTKILVVYLYFNDDGFLTSQHSFITKDLCDSLSISTRTLYRYFEELHSIGFDTNNDVVHFTKIKFKNQLTKNNYEEDIDETINHFNEEYRFNDLYGEAIDFDFIKVENPTLKHLQRLIYIIRQGFFEKNAKYKLYLDDLLESCEEENTKPTRQELSEVNKLKVLFSKEINKLKNDPKFIKLYGNLSTRTLERDIAEIKKATDFYAFLENDDSD